MSRTPVSSDAKHLSTLASAEYIESLYDQWKSAPESLPESWRMFFEGFEMAMCPRSCVAATQAEAQSGVIRLIDAYRRQGHLAANIDPLGHNLTSHPDLVLENFGFGNEDMQRVFDTGDFLALPRASLQDILKSLNDTYCGPIGFEYMHIQDPAIRRWIQEQIEPVLSCPTFDTARKLEIMELLIDAEVFENFLQNRYPGHKRFSLEGAESLIPAIHEIVELAPELGVEELVMGMAHRGRLNVLANILDKSYAMIFGEFEGFVPPDTLDGNGDVKYHLGYNSDHVNRRGKSLHISLTSNPSHLEAVNPVVEGRTRAKQRRSGDQQHRRRIVPLLIHGDAGFAGQGMVAETLNLSKLEGYRTGGTVHVIVNNQIGFTTDPSDARSSTYATDVAKMIEAPIFHVNGDNPCAVVYAAELALRFRQEFGQDVVLDMLCYRRHGHNEGDEPQFTQPRMYREIKKHPSVRKLYQQRLIENGELDEMQASELKAQFQKKLHEAHASAKKDAQASERFSYDGYWKDLNKPFSFEPVETGTTPGRLKAVARALTTVPVGFHINPKVARALPPRIHAIEENGEVDWSFAESLAFGTLLLEKIPVRLSGQDSARGTFSQRHAVWRDMETQQAHKPLNHIDPGQETFCVYNSLLSEAAVLGFDFGYALAEPDMLVLWEAQFGDFANGAQVIIDQFVMGSKAKWERSNGLVLLLPHGYEGQGPDHSSAYLERYLTGAAEQNIQVCNLTTPAQYFHALRRQMKRSFRLPLVLMTPKSLLRHKRCTSPVEELASGRFHEILDDDRDPEKVRTLLFCSGKVYYDLLEHRESHGIEDAAIIRFEQLYPFHFERMREIAGRYPHVERIAWVQEEPRNRGAWSYIHHVLEEVFPLFHPLYVGRNASASSATGYLKIHQQEQRRLVREAFEIK